MNKFSLINNLMISTPSYSEAMGGDTVIYICDHSENGAFGLKINKKSPMSLGIIFDRLSLPLTQKEFRDASVYMGGDDESERGFFLHESRPIKFYERTISIGDEIQLTASVDILQSISNGAGPAAFSMYIGCTLWGAGQLESELAENQWIVAPLSKSIIFQTDASLRYDLSLALLGITREKLSPQGGVG